MSSSRRAVAITLLVFFTASLAFGKTRWVFLDNVNLLLHEAGFAKGKRVTTHWAFCQTLRERGDVEVLENRRYVRDGNLVTAAGVSAGTDMALWLVGQLQSPDFARIVQRGMEYDPAPPYTAET